jgi:hypothetical protein
MNGPEILIPLVLGTLGIMTVLIPIVGLTARFALKPIVEAIARMREAQAGGAGRELAVLEQRVSLLEQQYQSLDTTVERLGEIKDFDRQLTAGGTPASVPPSRVADAGSSEKL